MQWDEQFPEGTREIECLAILSDGKSTYSKVVVIEARSYREILNETRNTINRYLRHFSHVTITPLLFDFEGVWGVKEDHGQES